MRVDIYLTDDNIAEAVHDWLNSYRDVNPAPTLAQIKATMGFGGRPSMRLQIVMDEDAPPSMRPRSAR